MAIDNEKPSGDALQHAEGPNPPTAWAAPSQSPIGWPVGWTMRESRDSQTWTDPPTEAAAMAPAPVDVDYGPTERRGEAEKNS